MGSSYNSIQERIFIKNFFWVLFVNFFFSFMTWLLRIRGSETFSYIYIVEYVCRDPDLKVCTIRKRFFVQMSSN